MELTAFPGCVARAARKAAMLSVVPVHTTQSLGKPAIIYITYFRLKVQQKDAKTMHTMACNIFQPSPLT